MDESKMDEYIKANHGYVKPHILVKLYNAGLIETQKMYLETRLAILRHKIENENISKNDILKEKNRIKNEHNITNATFYRYLKKETIKITNPLLFHLLITDGRKQLVKRLLKGNDDTYDIISSFVTSVAYKDTEIISYFPHDFTSDYCYRLWHEATKMCYTTESIFDFKIIFDKFEITQNGYDIQVTYDNGETTSSSIWHITNHNYLSEITRRITSWIHHNSFEDYSTIFLIKNKTGNNKISRVLELTSLVHKNYLLEK